MRPFATYVAHGAIQIYLLLSCRCRRRRCRCYRRCRRCCCCCYYSVVRVSVRACVVPVGHKVSTAKRLNRSRWRMHGGRLVWAQRTLYEMRSRFSHGQGNFWCRYMPAHCNNNVDYAKVDVRWQCGPLSNYSGHLFECIIRQLPKIQHCVESGRCETEKPWLFSGLCLRQH